jgi:hypothetical protein
VEFPPELANEIQARLDRAKEFYPGTVSRDGKAVCLEGGIGYENYVSPDGDVYVETYDLTTDEAPVIDRSRLAQIAVLMTGSSMIPGLSEMLPKRPPDTPTCGACHGTGWILQEVFRSSTGEKGILCQACAGLGWIEV